MYIHIVLFARASNSLRACVCKARRACVKEGGRDWVHIGKFFASCVCMCIYIIIYNIVHILCI